MHPPDVPSPLAAFGPRRRADEPVDAWVARVLAHRENRLHHTIDAAERARALAEANGADVDAAWRAGLMHDIARAVAVGEQAEILTALDAPPDAEEELHPWLLHSRLGALVAADCGGEEDPAVLAAIRNHTTLCAEPTQLDVIIFVADKLAWRKRPRAPWQEEAERDLAAGASPEEIARRILLLHAGEEHADVAPPAALVAARRWAAD